MALINTTTQRTATITVHRFGDVAVVPLGRWLDSAGSGVDFTSWHSVLVVAFKPQFDASDQQAFVDASPLLTTDGKIACLAAKAGMYTPLEYGPYPYVLTGQPTITDANQILGYGTLIWLDG